MRACTHTYIYICITYICIYIYKRVYTTAYNICWIKPPLLPLPSSSASAGRADADPPQNLRPANLATP